jgi:ABC-type transport system involved in cytochrome bd biosynthesis fused ATPase/permease subunit
VTVEGVDVAELEGEAWRQRVAFMPQRPWFAPRKTVADALRSAAPDAPVSKQREALGRVAVLDALTRRTDGDPLSIPVDTLSAGERQRLALARVLCRDADVILLDEPDANLDAAGIALVGELIHELAKDKMVAFAAHTPELLQVADHVVVFDRGRVIDERRSRAGQPAPAPVDTRP